MIKMIWIFTKLSETSNFQSFCQTWLLGSATDDCCLNMNIWKTFKLELLLRLSSILLSCWTEIFPHYKASSVRGHHLLGPEPEDTGSWRWEASTSLEDGTLQKWLTMTTNRAFCRKNDAVRKEDKYFIKIIDRCTLFAERGWGWRCHVMH